MVWPMSSVMKSIFGLRMRSLAFNDSRRGCVLAACPSGAPPAAVAILTAGAAHASFSPDTTVQITGAMMVVTAAPTTPELQVRESSVAKGDKKGSSRLASLKATKQKKKMPHANSLSPFGLTKKQTERNKKEGCCHYCQRVGLRFGPHTSSVCEHVKL